MKVTSIIKEVINSPVSNWSGSEITRNMIEEQIRERWGDSEVKNYDPLRNARTFSGWVSLGFRPKRGERALKSITYLDSRDEKGHVKKIRRNCNIFYYRQVQEINPKENI